MPKKTPTWMDEILKREEITWEEYIASFGVERNEFWELFWLNLEVFEEMFYEETGMELRLWLGEEEEED